MGEVAAALTKIRQAKAAIGSNGADTSDPGAQLMPDALGSIYPNMPDFSGQGQSQAQGGGMPQMEAPQMADQGAPQMAPPQAPPVENAYADTPYSDPKEIAQSIGRGSEDIPVTADGWTPNKESGIGRIMDTLLELRGRRPVFQDRTDDANLQSAMKDATKDDGPGIDQQKIINRVRKFNPDLADKMQDKFTTQQRLQSSLDKQDDVWNMKKEEMVRDRMASMMSAVKPDDKEGMSKMRDRVITYGKGKGFDLSDELPEDMNGFDYNAFRLGQIKVKDQEQLKQADRRGDQKDRSLDQGDKNITLRGESIQVTKDHNAKTEAVADRNATTAENNSDKRPDKRVRTYETKNGRLVAQDNKGYIIGPDGNKHLFITNDGTHWVHVNTVGPDGKPISN